jgi:hypothetical protein
MLNLDPTDLRKTYQAAIASAELHPLSGEDAKAARVDSLARMILRQLEKNAASREERNDS